MHFYNFFYLQLIVALYASKIDMIRDYFVFKNVGRVAGFSCGEIENDYRIVKLLNDAGIGVSVSQFASTIDISRFLHSIYWNLGIFLDLQCSISDKDVMELFYETSTHYMFDHLHQWLILGENMSHTVNLLNESTFSIITDIAIAIPRDDEYILYDVYNHCESCGGLLNVTELGTWSKNDGLRITLRSNKFSRRWNYHRMKIKIAGVVTAKPKNQDLVEYLREKNAIRTDNWSKFGFAIMEHVGDQFNFTFEVIKLDHWNKNDSSFGPLIAGLRDDIYHMGYFPSILTVERLNYVNVITQVWPARTCFMFLTVPSSKVDMNLIFRPFSRNVWYMILLLIIVIIFAMWTIFKLEKDAVYSDHGSTILIIAAALSQQGLPFISNQSSSRVAFFHIMIFGLLVYNYYSAAIVSSRLNAPLDKMNDSLYSLVKSKMSLAAFKDIYFSVLLQSPAEDVQYFKKHWETIPQKKRFLSIEDGMKKMKNLRFAYHAEPDNVYPFIDRNFDKEMICQLTEVHLLHPCSLGLWSTQHSPFQEITKIGILKISTSGIRKREVSRWSYRKPYCNKDKYHVSSVTIHEAIPVILVLCFGIILSAVICFIENVVFCKLSTKQEQIKKFGSRLKKRNQKNIAPGIKTTVKTKVAIRVTNKKKILSNK